MLKCHNCEKYKMVVKELLLLVFNLKSVKIEMPKLINVSVATMDAELQFNIQSNTTGKDLFEQVVKTIGLRKTWYFSLLYVDVKGNNCCLNMKNKILNIDVKDENIYVQANCLGTNIPNRREYGMNSGN